MSTAVTLKIQLDRTRFPMIWIESLNAYMSWLPATKIQFEYFLSETTYHGFSAKTYDEIRATSPRISPGRIAAKNYWQAFLTGVLPREAEAFVRWLGDDRGEMFDLPTGDEWYQVYDECQQIPAPTLEKLAEVGVTERAQSVFKRLYAALKPDHKRTLADVLLMNRGVHEWVRLEAGGTDDWGVAGFPVSGLGWGFVAPSNRLAIPVSDKESRHDSCGFRFLKR